MGRDDYPSGEAMPWLEAVVDEDEPRGVSAGKMLSALFLVVLGVAIVAGTLFYLGQQQGGSGPPELIKAPTGPYKVKPDDPGGLDISGDSGTAFATGAGEEQDSFLDVQKMSLPPQPKTDDGDDERKIYRKPPNETKEPVPEEPKPAPPPGTKGATVQLGAYGSSAKAETAWKMLSSRFPEVAGLTKQVESYSGGYRLRAVASSPDQARAACKAVAAGGENCFVVR